VDEYAGRVLAERYRLPRLADDEEPSQMPAFDTYSGQEVLVHQVPLPEVVSAEVAFGTGGQEPPDVLGPADDPGQRALRAAVAAARIPDHPGLVQVYDVFLDRGALWVVTEWVLAQPLAAIIAERPLSPYRAAEIGSDVLGALRAVHAEGWTHRNVTAQTVLVCDDGRAMLTGMCVAAAEEAVCGNDPVPPAAEAGTGYGEAGGPGTDILSGGPDAGGGAPEGGARTADPGGTAIRVWRGPSTERAREARIAMIGACVERWAPEQAGPFTGEQGELLGEGPPCDMWALGSLLFRAVQGHPPFPENDPHALLGTVRTEPPAFAEECGSLRPVVESLLRKNPQERPDAEEVRGWLRSLIRSAPEPDIGRATVMVSADVPGTVEIRKRGEVARRQRRGKAVVAHGKHKRGRQRSGPRRLGMLLLGLLILLVVVAIAVAALALPRREHSSGSPGSTPGTGPAGSASSEAPGALPPGLSTDFSMYTDPSGFRLALHHDLENRGKTGKGQVWFDDGDDVQMVVVPGRDTTKQYGTDVADYQVSKEPELAMYRKADWTAAAGLKELTVDGDPAAEGEFSWRKENRQYYARNLVMIRNGTYHVVLVYGPDRDRADISNYFEAAAETYTFSD
jgi:serine/threonine protein kinase